MFVPPYDSLIRALGLSREKLAEAAEVSIPTTLFHLLSKIAVKGGDFNEQGYLALNKDVARAVKSAQIKSAHFHYVQHGFWEGRRGAAPQVNQAWYLNAYPDVASAIEAGSLVSASQHYQDFGVDEFRVPNRYCKDHCLEWQLALNVGAEKKSAKEKLRRRNTAPLRPSATALAPPAPRPRRGSRHPA